MIRKLLSSVYRLRKISPTINFISMLPQNNAICTQQTDSLWLSRAQKLVPSLSNLHHKGQAGRVGIVGGSLEYTGLVVRIEAQTLANVYQAMYNNHEIIPVLRTTLLLVHFVSVRIWFMYSVVSQLALQLKHTVQNS